MIYSLDILQLQRPMGKTSNGSTCPMVTDMGTFLETTFLLANLGKNIGRIENFIVIE